MDKDRIEQDQTQDLESPEVAELEDKDLEDASGGAALEEVSGNFNCIC